MDDFFPDDKNEITPVLAATLKKKDKTDYDGQLTVDVYQTNDEIVIQSTIAGVDHGGLDISVTKEMVTIKGKRVMPEKIKSSDYYYQELFWGPFSRSIILPEDIDSDKAKASMKNGLLTIRLPKLHKK
ncbi:MAG: Hsp20/alpha crystallin family protein [Patescibacteria group bacterium]